MLLQRPPLPCTGSSCHPVTSPGSQGGHLGTTPAEETWPHPGLRRVDVTQGRKGLSNAPGIHLVQFPPYRSAVNFKG